MSRCVAERKYTQEQARKEFQQVFIPECNDDGTYSQVTCAALSLGLDHWVEVPGLGVKGMGPEPLSGKQSSCFRDASLRSLIV